MPKLYKFKSCDNLIRICDIIKSSKFYCADWKELNDPMEGTFDVEYFTQEFAEIVSENCKAVHELKGRTKILSLSAADEDIYMWAHYANGFTGVAFEVEVENDDFDRSSRAKVSDRSSLHKVKYIKNVKKFAHKAIGSHNEFVLKVLSQKLSAWSMEKEYRFLEESNFKKLKITKLIFGQRIDPTVLEILEKMCLDVNVPCVRSFIHRPSSKVKYSKFITQV